MSVSEFIFSWVKDIVLLFIIITLVDLVMPKGNMRRYINFVVGLLIIFTVVNPFINLSKIDFQLDREVFKNIDSQAKYDEAALNDQNNQIEVLYKDKLSADIKSYLESNTDYKISSISLDIHKGEDNFGNISHLDIYLGNQGEEPNERDIEISVKPVILEYKKKFEDKNDYLDIKELLAYRYDIDQDLIDVSTIKLED